MFAGREGTLGLTQGLPVYRQSIQSYSRQISRSSNAGRQLRIVELRLGSPIMAGLGNTSHGLTGREGRSFMVLGQSDPGMRKKGAMGRHGIIILGVALLILLTTGCSKTLKYTYVAEEGPPPTDPNTVELLPLEKLSTGEYEILGKVFARHKGGMLMGKGVDDLQETVIKAAAELGADAVIGFKTSKQDDNVMNSPNSRWGSGIAVKSVSPSGQPPKNIDFVVALCGTRSISYESWLQQQSEDLAEQKEAKRTTRSDHSSTAQTEVDESYEAFAKDSARTEKNWAYVISAAEYQLEKRGYYPITVPATDMNITVDMLGQADEAQKNEMLGPFAGHVVTMDLVGAGGINAGIFASASAEVKASLVYRQSNEIVWEGSASKSLFPTTGLLNVLFEGGETRQQKAISKAIKTLFDDLQPIN